MEQSGTRSPQSKFWNVREKGRKVWKKEVTHSSGLLGAVGGAEREEREKLVEVTLESGGACELDRMQALVGVVDMGIVNVEGGNGHSYSLE